MLHDQLIHVGCVLMGLQLDVDCIPTKAPCIWEHRDTYGTLNSILESYGISDKQVVIHIEKRFNYFEAFIARFTRAPKLLRRPLDKLNSALWDLLDGKRTLFQISQIMEECYGEDIIPANERCTASISKFIELNLVIIK